MPHKEEECVGRVGKARGVIMWWKDKEELKLHLKVITDIEMAQDLRVELRERGDYIKVLKQEACS